MTIQTCRLLAIAAAFPFLGLFLATSSDIRAAENAVRLSEPKQYGAPSPNKILVIIKGQIARPGHYYIERGMALSELAKLAGGLRECPDCNSLPKIVTLSSTITPNGKKDYMLSNPKVLGSVPLNDGDCASFWHYRL